MFFLSSKITHFFNKELGYPKELIQTIQEDFFEAFLIILETEINLYLDKNKLHDEYKQLLSIQKDHSYSDTELTDAFLDLYIKYPDITSSVNDKLQSFTDLFFAQIRSQMNEAQNQELNQLLQEEVNKYANIRKQLAQEI